MSGKNDKWSMFKNFMHNELEITKEDIRFWIKEAVSEQVTQLVNNQFDNFNLKHLIHSEITSHQMYTGERLKDDILRELVNQLLSRVQLDIVNSKHHYSHEEEKK